jgi:hypothetical protein
VSTSEPCGSCGLKTTGRSKLDPDHPLCSHCQARPLKAPTLASLGSKPGRAPKRRQCSRCLADETVSVVGREPNRRTESSLMKNGMCADRAACEVRQPLLS